jgi:L-threonylcarbamoyladenylate synthase
MKEKDIEEARDVISKGKLVIFPTETAYGIATDALNRDAVEKVFEAKRRPREKGLTTIVDSLETAKQYAELSNDEKKIVEELMPGPLTLISDKKGMVPDNLNEKFVFRISSGNIASKLSENGPITATSANISGKDTSYSIEDISEELLEEADYLIDSGELEQSPTSTIIEIENGEVIVHRKGPVSKKEVEEILK